MDKCVWKKRRDTITDREIFIIPWQIRYCMSELEQLVSEVGAVSFRPLTEGRRESLKNSSFRECEPRTDTSMSLGQARRFSNATERPVASTDFKSDDEFFDVWERVLDDWPKAEVRFAGMIDEYGYLDTAFLVYDDVVDESSFEEYAVVHFKHWLSMDPDENYGICPICDDRVTTSCIDVDVAARDYDDNLWSMVDEFDFREYPELGKCVRLWWDD